MKKVIAVIALVSSMGAAYADEPVALNDKQPIALNDNQMDNVSAGVGFAFTTSGAFAVGSIAAATQTAGFSTVRALGPNYTLSTSGSLSRSIGF